MCFDLVGWTLVVASSIRPRMPSADNFSCVAPQSPSRIVVLEDSPTICMSGGRREVDDPVARLVSRYSSSPLSGPIHHHRSRKTAAAWEKAAADLRKAAYNEGYTKGYEHGMRGGLATGYTSGYAEGKRTHCLVDVGRYLACSKEDEGGIRIAKTVRL